VPLFDLFMRNRATLGRVARSAGVRRLAARTWHWLRRNTPANARRNIEAHYDLGNDFYREWLDDSLTYSSAIFARPDEPLEAAQRRKLIAMLERTGARPGQEVLEIGCGWGSFAAVAAERGVRVHGLTLSTEQQQVVEARGLPGVTVALADYRDERGRYDAVCSIEMVEAVGQEFWPAYLDTIARVLPSGGRAAIQYISIAEDVFPAYSESVDFIQRYIFPGGMLISTERFRALAQARGLAWTDHQGFWSRLCGNASTMARALRRSRGRAASPGPARPRFRQALAILSAVLRGRLPRRRHRRAAGHAGEALTRSKWVLSNPLTASSAIRSATSSGGFTPAGSSPG
jgi:cyclopropane-fatty-acyl-phospholipid synthase